MDGTTPRDLPHVLIVIGDDPVWPLERALTTAGFRVDTASIVAAIRETAEETRPEVIVVAYRTDLRHRAWDVLTVLRGARSLRGLPVVVVPDDVEQMAMFGDRFARLGMAVLLNPNDAVLVETVRRQLANPP